MYCLRKSACALLLFVPLSQHTALYTACAVAAFARAVVTYALPSARDSGAMLIVVAAASALSAIAGAAAACMSHADRRRCGGLGVFVLLFFTL